MKRHHSKISFGSPLPSLLFYFSSVGGVLHYPADLMLFFCAPASPWPNAAEWVWTMTIIVYHQSPMHPLSLLVLQTWKCNRFYWACRKCTRFYWACRKCTRFSLLVGLTRFATFNNIVEHFLNSLTLCLTLPVPRCRMIFLNPSH
jgi:hypothetical protein